MRIALRAGRAELHAITSFDRDFIDMDMISRLAAVIVVHHAQLDPYGMVAALARQLPCVVWVDNAPAGHPSTPRWDGQQHVHVIENRNRGGVAGAYNRALDHLDRERPDVTHVVFLDEDSDPRSLVDLLQDPATAALLGDPRTAAVAPAHRDRATGLRGQPVVLSRFGFRSLPRESTGIHQVSFLINSMSVWRREALRRIGPFNEELAVDQVDIEYCLRANRSGLKLALNGDHEFLHSIGQRRRYRLFGRELQTSGHGPRRRCLIGRNTAWLARRYFAGEPGFALLCMVRLTHEALGIAMAEDDKKSKLWHLLRGICMGLRRSRLDSADALLCSGSRQGHHV